ncbi:hypothetical protein D3C80_930290 [compost metagenome]
MGLYKGGGRAGGAVTGFDHLDAVLRRRRTCAVEVVDEHLGRAGDGAAADHQAIGSSAIAGQHAVQAQGAVVAGVIALDAQAAHGIIAGGEVKCACVADCGALARGKRSDHPLA